jgi:predicted MFS family arabinose efflux permease
LVLALTNSPAQAGLVAALMSLPGLLIGLPAGVLIDRMDRKRVMIACDLLRAVALGSIPVALALGRLGMPLLYGVAVVTGAGRVCFILARTAALPRVVPPERLVEAVAHNEVSQSLVTLAGPPLGGAIFALGRALPFVADAVSFTASGGTLALIRTPFQGERGPRRRLWPELLEGFAWLVRQPLVRFMSLVYGGFALFLSGEELCVLVLARDRGASPLGIGLIFAAGGAGGLVGALLAPRIQRRWRFGQVMPVLQWGYVLTLPIYIFAPSVAMMALAMALGLCNDQIYDVLWPSLRMRLIPDALQGRVTSVYTLLVRVLQPLGLTLAGVLIQRLGASAALVVEAVGLTLLAVAVMLNPHVRAAGKEKV